MPTYEEFFLNSSVTVRRIDLLEISHPNMSQVYRCLRNKGSTNNELIVTLETGEQATFKYVPMRFEKGEFTGNMEQKIKVTFGDLGELIPDEIDRIELADADDIKPMVRYWQYASNNLRNPLVGPVILQIKSFASNWQGCMFDAIAPQINVSGTGEIYNLEDIPMLRETL